MAKKINYTPKTTSASTVYLQLEDSDLAMLKSELIRWLSLMSESTTIDNDDWQQILAMYWRRRSRSLPRGANGLNSPESFIAGLINNLVFGTQRDISEIQMEAVRDISNNLSMINESVEPIVFQIGF